MASAVLHLRHADTAGSPHRSGNHDPIGIKVARIQPGLLRRRPARLLVALELTQPGKPPVKPGSPRDARLPAPGVMDPLDPKLGTPRADDLQAHLARRTRRSAQRCSRSSMWQASSYAWVVTGVEGEAGAANGVSAAASRSYECSPSRSRVNSFLNVLGVPEQNVPATWGKQGVEVMLERAGDIADVVLAAQLLVDRGSQGVPRIGPAPQCAGERQTPGEDASGSALGSATVGHGVSR